MRVARGPWAAATFALVASFFASTARAGGLFIFDRGLRPLSRGGALVAGADDPHALWHNPAGLSESGRQVLFDVTSTAMFASYQRISADGSRSAIAHSQVLPLPVPTFAVSHDLSAKSVTFGAGVFAPNAVLLNWPRSLDAGGSRAPGPTRYSLISLRGSALAALAFGLAWSGLEGLSLGADAQVMTGRFRAEVALSACGDGIVCNFPEDPSYDVYTTLDALPVYGVTGALGAKYTFRNVLRIGVAATMPYVLRGEARLTTTLPAGNPLLEHAYIEGDRASLSLNMPLTVRAGVELRPRPSLRLEVAFAWEQWSTQEEIRVQPKDVTLTHVRGIGDYQLGTVPLPRAMRDTWSVRAGLESFLGRRVAPSDPSRRLLALRAGLAYETGAFDRHTLTPLTIDVDKFLLTGGLGVYLASAVRLDLAAGWYAMRDMTVIDSTIARPQALRPPSSAGRTTLGNGRYVTDAFYVGLGLAMLLGS